MFTEWKRGGAKREGGVKKEVRERIQDKKGKGGVGEGDNRGGK